MSALGSSPKRLSGTFAGVRGAMAALAAPAENDFDRSIRTLTLLGGAICASIILLVFGWGAIATLSGAVMAPGSVVVDGSLKKVQHPSGGVVSQILVKNGDVVSAGDVLMRLDAVVVKSNLAVVTKTLDEIGARRARLEAERDGAEQLGFPKDFIARAASEPDVAAIMAGESRLFAARRDARAGKKAQLHEQSAQLREQIGGLASQIDGKAREIELIKEELVGVSDLYGKKLIPLTRLNNLRREAARLEGERGALVGSTADAKGKMAEIALQIIQVDQDLRQEVVDQLREADAKVGEFVERKIKAQDQLDRIDIKSPQDGVVHQLKVHTVGGVIEPAEVLMDIVPRAEALVIEAKVAPQDIDQVHTGQGAYVRFPAFEQRTTPEFQASVEFVSADVTKDPNERSPEPPSYTARLKLAGDKNRKLRLQPGMPAEIHIQTGDRQALSYFLKPLTDQFARAFQSR